MLISVAPRGSPFCRRPCSLSRTQARILPDDKCLALVYFLALAGALRAGALAGKRSSRVHPLGLGASAGGSAPGHRLPAPGRHLAPTGGPPVRRPSSPSPTRSSKAPAHPANPEARPPLLWPSRGPAREPRRPGPSGSDGEALRGLHPARDRPRPVLGNSPLTASSRSWSARTPCPRRKGRHGEARATREFSVQES